ncbi:MAG: fibronectin type III-like domain-contianing protein, partial [Muribaculaceae bacterium]|nr:fibronectin type III-like domain-contianing protein [Muribaculaceae bacterium]
RVALQPGETKKVEFLLDNDTFSWFDTANEEMLPLYGEYIIRYGSSSDPAQQQSLPYTFKQ